MAYRYDDLKPLVFSDEGQRMLLRVRDHAQQLIAKAGAATCAKLMAGAGSGDSWLQLACVDRLVELGDLRRITPVGSCATQDEVFVSPRWS